MTSNSSVSHGVFLSLFRRLERLEPDGSTKVVEAAVLMVTIKIDAITSDIAYRAVA